MKYLSSQPFTFAVSQPRTTDSLVRMFNREEESRHRQRKASKPHEYLNGGGMCQVCALAREAAIHSVVGCDNTDYQRVLTQHMRQMPHDRESPLPSPFIPAGEDDVCLVCSGPIPQEWASYVKIMDGVVRRAHLTCGDRVNAQQDGVK